MIKNHIWIFLNNLYNFSKLYYNNKEKIKER